MQSLSPQELREWQERHHPVVLIDVREDWEHSAFNIGGLNISLSELAKRKAEIPANVDTVIYCERGIRSVIAIQRLEALGYTRLYNLSGGMQAWRKAT